MVSEEKLIQKKLNEFKEDLVFWKSWIEKNRPELHKYLLNNQDLSKKNQVFLTSYNTLEPSPSESDSFLTYQIFKSNKENFDVSLLYDFIELTKLHPLKLTTKEWEEILLNEEIKGKKIYSFKRVDSFLTTFIFLSKFKNLNKENHISNFPPEIIQK